MKKLASMILLCTLLVLTMPQARAAAPEIDAVYAAPGQQIITAADGEGADATVLYLYADGSCRIRLFRAGQPVSGAGGVGALAGSVLNFRRTGDYSARSYALDELGFVRLYPTQTYAPIPEAEVPEIWDDWSQTVDEGVDTPIEITGYTAWTEDSGFRFPAAGDKVAVLSPSALPGWDQIAAVEEGLRSWGFVPVQGRHVYADVRTIEECLEDFREALEDPEIRAIFCVRGGYGATEVADALPRELIAAADKPIIGFSDITAYQMAWAAAGLPSVHAGMSGTFAEDFPVECAEAERRMMLGQIPAYRCPADAYCREGTAEGVLIGGNLSTVSAALDTAYDCTKTGRPYILFLEEVGENMQHIHRYLTILKHKGVLDRAAGIVFGEWTGLPADYTGNYGEARGGLFDSVADMISRQFLDGLDIPIAFGFPAGHGETNYPLLMGAKAKLEVSGESYTLSWPAPEEN